jgi:hypothetical protein
MLMDTFLPARCFIDIRLHRFGIGKFERRKNVNKKLPPKNLFVAENCTFSCRAILFGYGIGNTPLTDFYRS